MVFIPYVFGFIGTDHLRTKIIIKDETLEQVRQFPYLGCSISYQFSNDVEFKLAKFLQLIGTINPLNPELNPICYLLALLGAHHFLHVSRIRVKLLTFRLLMSYIYGAPILDVSRSHTTTQHSR